MRTCSHAFARAAVAGVDSLGVKLLRTSWSCEDMVWRRRYAFPVAAGGGSAEAGAVRNSSPHSPVTVVFAFIFLLLVFVLRAGLRATSPGKVRTKRRVVLDERNGFLRRTYESEARGFCTKKKQCAEKSRITCIERRVESRASREHLT
jgi:hypothetical protein